MLHAQVACSGCRTLSVVQHDAEAEDTEERRKGYKHKMKSFFSGPAQQAATASPGMAALLRESHSPAGSLAMRFPSKREPGLVFGELARSREHVSYPLG